jgi:hypothetical protein
MVVDVQEPMTGGKHIMSFQFMVLSLYYGIQSEYEIQTMALGVGSVTTPSLFS